MKKILLSLLAISVFFTLKAQSTTKEDTSMHATAVAVCDCLNKANITDNTTTDQLQQIFLNCIFTSAPGFVAKLGANAGDMNAAQELSTQLGMEMLKINCPAFTKIATAMGGSELQMTLPGNTQTEEVKSTDGIVVKVEEKDFTYITLKTPTGRELNFLYYKYVPGSDEWIKDPATLLKNKNVSITYAESEVYQPKYKQFMNVKEIRTLTIK